MGTATVPRTNRPLAELLGDPPVVRWTTRYLKRLLIERSAIRARLENPGGSVILMAIERVEEDPFSQFMGNDFHLDLIEAEEAINQLPVADRMALLHWVNELTPAQTVEYLEARGRITKKGLYTRAERRAETLTETLNDRES